MRIAVPFVFLFGLSALPRLNGQSVQCVTLSDGCDAGSVNEDAVSDAIAKFQNGLLYGGGDPIVVSSALGGDNLAVITYLCNNGSPPPQLEGSVIRASFRKILSCTNKCGGVASSSNSGCGFGVFIANDAANLPCFSKAIDVTPTGTTKLPETGPATPTINPSDSDPWEFDSCQSDDASARALPNSQSSDDMTVDQCLELADSYKYAALQGGKICYWGDELGSSSHSVDVSQCNIPCAGKSGELCGGNLKNLIYKDTDWSIPNVDDMILLIEDFFYCEQALKNDLDDYESQRVQANEEGDEEDDEEGGNKLRKRIIPAIWAARLAAGWARVRGTCARCLPAGVRAERRLQAAWRYLAQHLAQYIREETIETLRTQFRDLVWDSLTSIFRLFRTNGNQLIAINPDRAVQAAGIATSGLAIVVAYADEIFALANALNWYGGDVRGSGQIVPAPTDGSLDGLDPDDQVIEPDPEDEPSEDPNDLPPCPCSVLGCGIFKRSLDQSEPMELENTTEHVLEKRGGRKAYKVTRCPGLAYITNPYPSYSVLKSSRTRLGLVPAIHYDTVFFSQPPLTQCLWQLGGFAAKQPKTPGVPGTLATYATEHAFENNLMAGFFDHMIDIQCAPCSADQFGNGLREMFFTLLANTPGSPYDIFPFSLYLVNQMSWYTARGGNAAQLQEFFILEQRVNTNKFNILAGESSLNQVWELTMDLAVYIHKIGRVQNAFNYMNQATVANAFIAVVTRIEGVFRTFDTDTFYGALPQNRPRATTTCDQGVGYDPATMGNLPRPTWELHFYNYMNAVLIDTETKMAEWVAQTHRIILEGMNARWPVLSFSQADIQKRAEVNAWLAVVTAPGGILHPNSYKFDRTTYGTKFYF
ncbi:hypothetical protein TWF694_008068 [Orbilia ellipsospora]|uniref:WSC domain-containing protein n=1 Tax=Orbilia ellipsospora TaxID=2528407 RepID=A0AAV9XFZ3_9PEZI